MSASLSQSQRQQSAREPLTAPFPVQTYELSYVFPRALIVPQQTRRSYAYAHASNAHNTGTYSSRASARLSRAPSTRSGPHGSSTGPESGSPESASERERRRSVSQRSIPISALVIPHTRLPSAVHPPHTMCHPRRPPRRVETGLTLRFRTSEEEGSPAQAWMFYIALVLFPLWWIAAVWRVPKTRVDRRDGYGEGGATG
ncbi:hypothetical protein V8E53_014223 [Lactarius tabidus]